jgi:hypothetical protein
LTVLDLFCGLGGFSQAFRDRGHRVIGVDIVPPADVIADVRALPFNGRLKVDAILASPPCQEFSKWALRGWNRCKGRETPDPSGDAIGLVRAAVDAIEALQPKWWILENVAGMRPWVRDFLGLPTIRWGSRYMWGHFPLPFIADGPDLYGKFTLSRTGRPDGIGGGLRQRKRSLIPPRISLRLCEAMERAHA